jgi:hypothetical protein
MSITQSKISEPQPPLDYLIEYTKGAIAKEAASVERLAEQGRDFTDAAKHLTDMVVNLAALLQKKRADRYVDSREVPLITQPRNMSCKI